MEKKMPLTCPSCAVPLHISQMRCPACQTTVSGDYDTPRLMRLDVEERDFIEAFVLSSGSLKQMAALMEVSYPTVRNTLDEIIEKLKTLNN